MRLAILAALLLAAVDSAADIYVSQPPGEPPKFATHRLDASYRLFLREEHTPRIGSAETGRPASGHPHSSVDATIERVAGKHAVDPALVRAVIEVESRFERMRFHPRVRWA